MKIFSIWESVEKPRVEKNQRWKTGQGEIRHCKLQTLAPSLKLLPPMEIHVLVLHFAHTYSSLPKNNQTSEKHHKRSKCTLLSPISTFLFFFLSLRNEIKMGGTPHFPGKVDNSFRRYFETESYPDVVFCFLSSIWKMKWRI